MADFNWINAVPVRDWSVPDRGWSVLSISAQEFARKSKLQSSEDAASLFSAWAMQQIHRNYSLLLDEKDDRESYVVIGMRANPVIRDLRQKSLRYQKR